VNVVARDRELAALATVTDDPGPIVTFVHGASGIGKTTILRALDATLAERGVRRVFVDGRDVEPTPRGVLWALERSLGTGKATASSVGAALGETPGRGVVIIDSYEALGLADSWLRTVFVPALTENVRLVIGTRLPPGPQWTQALEWRGLVDTLELQPLDDAHAHALLARFGVPRDEAERIVAIAGGLPVALTLAGAAAATATPMPDRPPTHEQVLAELARRFVDGLDDRQVREAVEAASVVRRLTAPLLEALVPEGVPELLFARLRALAFCTMESDGLRLHEAVRGAVAAELRAADPGRYRRYQQVAWRRLDTELRRTGRHELWRYTADLIHLVANPVWRHAFFPPGSTTLAVEPARPSHTPAIRALAARHERPTAAGLIELWLEEAFHAFHVVLDAAGEVVGFYCLCDAARATPRLVREDPVAAAWSAHLAEQPMRNGEVALFLRRWLSADAGEAPSPAQAAGWLDIKRTYLELRPSLRRVYLALQDLSPYAEVASTLGFEPLGPHPVELGDTTFQSAVLDMGPDSVDGWLSRLVAAELGLKSKSILDRARRGVRRSDGFLPLTRREFDVMTCLEEREGAVVSRDELLDEVWGPTFDGGSNVVDAVITSLRRKLGADAGLIETIRGHGYLFRGSPTA